MVNGIVFNFLIIVFSLVFLVVNLIFIELGLLVWLEVLEGLFWFVGWSVYFWDESLLLGNGMKEIFIERS